MKVAEANFTHYTYIYSLSCVDCYSPTLDAFIEDMKSFRDEVVEYYLTEENDDDDANHDDDDANHGDDDDDDVKEEQK